MGLAERICTRNSYALRLRLRGRCHPNLRSARAQQHSRAFSRRRPGGHNVVNQQHLAPSDGLGVRNAEGPTQTLTPLMWLHRKQCMRVLHASEGFGIELESPSTAQLAQMLYSRLCEQLRLVESATALTSSEQRYGNYDQLTRSLILELQDGLRQVLAEQMPGNRARAVELEQVQHSANLGVVLGVGYCACKLRRSQPAHRALGYSHCRSESRGLHAQRIATPAAEHIRQLVLRFYARNTSLTDPCPAYRNYWPAAQPAVPRPNGIHHVDDSPTNRRPATSEDARYCAPASSRAGLMHTCLMARRPRVPEPDILDAYAEDGPHPRHGMKKHQLCPMPTV